MVAQILKNLIDFHGNLRLIFILYVIVLFNDADASVECRIINQ